MSRKMKRRLVGGVGFAAILTLFGAFVTVPLRSQSAVAGSEAREIRLEIRLHRLRRHTNKLTRAIWAYLAVRERVPLVRIA